jgi:hypothetical protein
VEVMTCVVVVRRQPGEMKGLERMLAEPLFSFQRDCVVIDSIPSSL